MLDGAPPNNPTPCQLIKVVIIDDHDMTRVGIKFLLAKYSDIEVVGEASDGKMGIDLCTQLSPDVVLMDISMPNLNGIDATKIITAKNPSIKVLMLTAFCDKGEVMSSLLVGARGYVSKSVDEDTLVNAIRTVKGGDIWLDSSVADHFRTSLALHSDSEKRDKIQVENFSERELQIITLLVEGRTNREIASELYLSIDTIKSHLKVIMQKLEVKDRTEAAVKAIRQGLV